MKRACWPASLSAASAMAASFCSWLSTFASSRKVAELKLKKSPHAWCCCGASPLSSSDCWSENALQRKNVELRRRMSSIDELSPLRLASTMHARATRCGEHRRARAHSPSSSAALCIVCHTDCLFHTFITSLPSECTDASRSPEQSAFGEASWRLACSHSICSMKSNVIVVKRSACSCASALSARRRLTEMPAYRSSMRTSRSGSTPSVSSRSRSCTISCTAALCDFTGSGRLSEMHSFRWILLAQSSTLDACSRVFEITLSLLEDEAPSNEHACLGSVDSMRAASPGVTGVYSG